jgi:predicted MPP superfamily phosphohydrolase
LFRELAAVEARLGRFAVLGNHDWTSDPSVITQDLQRAGIEVLTNRNVRLPSPFEHVWICGLDDHCFGMPDAQGAFSGADGFRIVLMHAPSGLLDIGDHRFELAFCGHTHGGQVALPGGWPVIVPKGALSRRYARGLYRLPNERTLVVSVGLGCATIPLRTYSDPEIILCTLAC